MATFGSHRAMPSRPDARAAQPADGDLWEAVAPVGGGVSEARNDADLWEASNGARSESEPKASGFARPEARGRRPSADTASQPRCIGRKPDNSGNEPAAERLRSEAFPHGASQGSRLRKGVDVMANECPRAAHDDERDVVEADGDCDSANPPSLAVTSRNTTHSPSRATTSTSPSGHDHPVEMTS